MRKLLLSVLPIFVLAGECPLKTEAYWKGYKGSEKVIKEYKGDKSTKKAYISGYVSTMCQNICEIKIYVESDQPNPKLLNPCIDACLNGANDAYNGVKPRIKPCK